MNEPEIQNFWNSHPCGELQVGGLQQAHRGDYEAFFAGYDTHRYSKEGHILDCLDGID